MAWALSPPAAIPIEVGTSFNCSSVNPIVLSCNSPVTRLPSLSKKRQQQSPTVSSSFKILLSFSVNNPCQELSSIRSSPPTPTITLSNFAQLSFNLVKYYDSIIPLAKCGDS